MDVGDFWLKSLSLSHGDGGESDGLGWAWLEGCPLLSCGMITTWQGWKRGSCCDIGGPWRILLGWEGGSSLLCGSTGSHWYEGGPGGFWFGPDGRPDHGSGGGRVLCVWDLDILESSKTRGLLTGRQNGHFSSSVGMSYHSKDKGLQKSAVCIGLAVMETCEGVIAWNPWCRQLYCVPRSAGNSQERRGPLKSKAPGRAQYDLAEQ